MTKLRVNFHLSLSNRFFSLDNSSVMSYIDSKKKKKKKINHLIKSTLNKEIITKITK